MRMTKPRPEPTIWRGCRQRRHLATNFENEEILSFLNFTNDFYVLHGRGPLQREPLVAAAVDAGGS